MDGRINADGGIISDGGMVSFLRLVHCIGGTHTRGAEVHVQKV
jgi:hypothetical protein